MATGRDITQTALRYNGLPYILGAEADLTGRVFPKALDCSELVQLACWLNGIPAPDGTVNQFPWMTPCSVAHAIGTPGALLMVYHGPNSGGGLGNHIAISLGDGHTIEARSTRYGVGVFLSTNRGWTHAGLIPGVDYSTVTTPPIGAIIMGTPIGNIDLCERTADGKIHVSGWAYDADEPGKSIGIHVYVEDVGPMTVVADRARPDINDAYKIPGNHGFDVVVPPVVRNSVRVYAIDTTDPNQNTMLGQRDVQVPLI